MILRLSFGGTICVEYFADIFRFGYILWSLYRLYKRKNYPTISHYS